MYEKCESVALPATASYQMSNLSCLVLRGKTYLGVIHKGEFMIICMSSEKNTLINRTVPKISPRQMIFKGTWIWHKTPLLVLLSTSSVYIFDWDGVILLHTHHLPSQNGVGFSSLKGIAALPTGRICIGTHEGEILLLNLKDSDNLAFVEEGRLKLFTSPTSVLASKKNILAATDIRGTIIICSDDGPSLEKKLSIQPYGLNSCITCLEIMSDVTIAGYSSGHIRIFDNNLGHMKAEVCAHAKLITGLDLAEDSKMLLSISEDTFARVWKIDSSTPTLIEHKFSTREKNEVLVGGRFTEERGTAFVVSAYDADHIFSFAI